MRYRRLPIEIESPEERGYDSIRHNLTESSVRDRTLADIGFDLRSVAEVPLAYVDHRGDERLRGLIASDALITPGAAVSAADVLITPGAAAALFMVATSLLEAGDHAVIERTNYATNIETPLVIGATVDHVDLSFDDGFRLDLDRVADLVRPGSTRLVSVTTPHNPTGVSLTTAELTTLVELTDRAGSTLLVDETYRDMAAGDPPPVAATLGDHVISVSSMSKTYGLPGIRVGWIISRDRERMETLLAAKEQIVISGSILDEAVAAHTLAARDRLLPPILESISQHRSAVAGWMSQQELVEWVAPDGGVVCFPRLAESVDPDDFYRHLNEVGGTYVGEGHWFDAERRHFRLGYGWPTTDELIGGLTAIGAAAQAAQAVGR